MKRRPLLRFTKWSADDVARCAGQTERASIPAICNPEVALIIRSVASCTNAVPQLGVYRCLQRGRAHSCDVAPVRSAPCTAMFDISADRLWRCHERLPPQLEARFCSLGRLTSQESVASAHPCNTVASSHGGEWRRGQSMVGHLTMTRPRQHSSCTRMHERLLSGGEGLSATPEADT